MVIILTMSLLLNILKYLTELPPEVQLPVPHGVDVLARALDDVRRQLHHLCPLDLLDDSEYLKDLVTIKLAASSLTT